MCSIRTEYFTGVLLVLHLICYTSTRFCSFTYGASLNTSEGIKHIFNGDCNLKDSGVTARKKILKSGNFAEGGLLSPHRSPINITFPTRKNCTSFSSSTNVPKNNATQIFQESYKNSNNTKYTNSALHNHIQIKTLLPAKLNVTGSSLFLGLPEVIHVNGTSSIKPRKGVYYNKIVPRKGVESDRKANLNLNYLCTWLGENECYNSKELTDFDCKCCRQSNALGKTVRQNYQVNCTNCKPMIPEIPDDKLTCENICCYDKYHKTVSNSNTGDMNYKNVNFTSRFKLNNETSSNYEKIKELSGAIANLTKSSKLKPNITKVPYDKEVVTEILSKTKQKIFAPVIVSLLLLPFIGILVFFVLRKMKEIWNKRYYKRMDFLIDGMYQD